MPAEVKVEEIGPCKKRLRIQVPKEDLKETLEQSYTELMNNAVFPGFRKGKVPRRLVEKRFGDDVKEDVKQKTMAKSLREALEKNSMTPVGEANYENIEFDLDKVLSFDVTFEVLPTFEVENYKGLKLNRKSAEPSDEDVYNAVQDLRRRAAVLTTVETPAEKGDLAICDYEVQVGDQKIANAQDAEIAADGMNVVGISPEDVAKLLIGVKAGEDRAGKMKLTEQFGREDLRGKEAEVRFKVKSVKRSIMPEVDEAFAKKMGFDALKEMNDYVREQMRAKREEWVRLDMERQACDAILSAINFELPLDLVKQQTEENLRRWKTRLMMRGISPEQLGRETERLRAASEEEVTRDFRVYLILDKIAQKEKIFATEDDVEDRIVRMASQRGISPVQMKQRLESEGAMSSLRGEIRHQKVLAFLLTQSQIVDVKKSITAGPDEEEKEGQEGQKPVVVGGGAGAPEAPKEEKKSLIVTPDDMRAAAAQRAEAEPSRDPGRLIVTPEEAARERERQ